MVYIDAFECGFVGFRARFSRLHLLLLLLLLPLLLLLLLVLLLLLLQEWHIIGINTSKWRSRVLAPMPLFLIAMLVISEWYMYCCCCCRSGTL
jgi:hypothetical protein